MVNLDPANEDHQKVNEKENVELPAVKTPRAQKDAGAKGNAVNKAAREDLILRLRDNQQRYTCRTRGCK